jgi:hypothetical protein
MKPILKTFIFCLSCFFIFSCEERNIEFVLGDEMEYPFEISGSETFDEQYYVSEYELYEITEDLDDEVRNNILNLDIEQVDVQLLAHGGLNTAESATVTVYFKWDDKAWDDPTAQIDSLFSRYTESVTTDSTHFTMLVNQLDETTIGHLRDRLDAAARNIDVSAFNVRAVGTVNGGYLEATLTVRVKISLVTRETF